MSHDLLIGCSEGFSIDQLREWLDRRPDVFEDPHGRGVYVLAGSPERCDALWEQRLHDISKLPRASYVHLGNSVIALQQSLGSSDSWRTGLEMLRWLTTQHRCSIRIDGFDDLTEQVAQRGVESLYYPEISGVPAEWKSALIEVGFFRELDADGEGVSIVDARRGAGGPDDDALARYLGAGHIYRGSDEIAVDYFTQEELGHPHIRTDGVYVWPSDLAHYVLVHHVRLPRHFRLHAQRNDWRVPHVDLAALPGSRRVPPLAAAELERLQYACLDWPVVGDSCTLEVGTSIVMGRRIQLGTGDEVRLGYRRFTGLPVLLTLTLAHRGGLEAIEEQLSLPWPRVARLISIAPLLGGSIPYDDVLIEQLPAGAPASARGAWAEPEVLRLGADLARLLADVHDSGGILDGIRPELIYVDGEGALTGIVPRGPRFIASAPARASGPRSYAVPYQGFESLALGKSFDEPGDIFALCATLQHLATGRHPFGDEWPEILQRVVANAREPYAGSKELDKILARGMDPDPSRRPTAEELAKRLAELAL